jgi:hypothetical protein
MQVISLKKDFDFSKILIASDWNLAPDIEPKMHRIHAYPAKFPAFLASKAIDYARSQNISVNLVGRYILWLWYGCL